MQLLLRESAGRFRYTQKCDKEIPYSLWWRAFESVGSFYSLNKSRGRREPLLEVCVSILSGTGPWFKLLRVRAQLPRSLVVYWDRLKTIDNVKKHDQRNGIMECNHIA